jgi:hypothetical protein
MKKILAAILLSFGLYSCDDGDITVTSFDLENSDLTLCEINGKKVLWAVNNEDVFESMSLELKDNSLNDTLTQRILTLDVSDEPIEINLSGEDNRLVYRIYDGEITGRAYFCQGVPPGSPRVLEEYVSAGGTVLITTNFNDLALDANADGDGLTNAEEGYDPEGGNHLDSDGDGIPDYLDIDDDNDNVSTSGEIDAGPNDFTTEEGYLDTDGDGIPNYLDPDDDGDGVLTRHEVNEEDIQRAIDENIEGSLSPRLNAVADGLANYLNRDLFEPNFEHDLQLDHSISRTYRSSIQIINFNLIRQDGSGEDIRFDSYTLGRFTTGGIPFKQLTNQQQENEPDEDEEDGEENTED